MATLTFEIPDEIITFIKTDLKVEPSTYILNECLKPLINIYQSRVNDNKLAEAKIKINSEIAKTKKSLKITVK